MVLFRALLLAAAVCTMTSCSPSDSGTVAEDVSAQKSISYTYNTSELESMKLINDYRVSIGLNALEKINYVSVKSDEHDQYMIENNVVNHNDFVARSEEIMKVFGAKSVSENIAYNYCTPKAALDAWLNSPGHRENIEGDFTHFGIAVRENPVNGKKYYTNIFVKI